MIFPSSCLFISLLSKVPEPYRLKYTSLFVPFDHFSTRWVFYYRANLITISYIID